MGGGTWTRRVKERSDGEVECEIRGKKKGNRRAAIKNDDTRYLLLCSQDCTRAPIIVVRELIPTPTETETLTVILAALQSDLNLKS